MKRFWLAVIVVSFALCAVAFGVSVYEGNPGHQLEAVSTYAGCVFLVVGFFAVVALVGLREDSVSHDDDDEEQP